MKIVFVSLLVLLLLGSFAAAVNATPSGLPLAVAGSVRVSPATYYEPYPVQPGGLFDFWVRVENSGKSTDAAVRDIECRLAVKFPFSSADPSDDLKRWVGSLAPTQAALLKFRLKASETAAEGNNELALECRSENTAWTQATLGISVRTTNPVAQIIGAELQPSEFAPGSRGLLKVAVQNKASADLKNVQVKLDFSSASLPLSPLHSSGEAFVTQVAAGGQGAFSFEIAVQPKAGAGVYKLPVTLSYEDEHGGKYSRDSTLSITVNAPPQLLASVDRTDSLQKGAKGKVTVALTNRGLADIKRLTATVNAGRSYELLSPATLYLGDVDSNDFDTFEIELFVNDSVRELAIPLESEFLDGLNKRHSQLDVIRVRVYTAEELGSLQLVQASTSPLAYIALVVLAAAAYFAYKRFFKKRG